MLHIVCMHVQYCLCIYLQALVKATSEIERLQSELEAVRQSALTAAETQAASPHSVPENECMELGVEQCSMEQSQKETAEELHQGSDKDAECELERLCRALRESESECGRLRSRVAELQREFDSEDPAPSPLPPVPPPGTSSEVRTLGSSHELSCVNVLVKHESA